MKNYDSNLARRDPSILSKFCVDTAFQRASDRYGMYVKDTTVANECLWNHKDYSSFPAEFRAQLLLLGIA